MSPASEGPAPEGPAPEGPAPEGPAPERPEVVLFLRVPTPGRAKTRLIPALGAEGAAALAQAMAEDVVGLVESCGLRLTLAVDGAEDAPFIHHLSRGVHRVLAQVQGGLGERLEAALPAGPALALGADAPTLPAALLLQAARLEREVVLGPAFDGGYTLLAWRRARPGLLRGIPWSTEGVLAATVAQARAEGVEPALLPFWYDVDTPDDLRFLRQHLRVLPPAVAPHTRALLRDLE